MGGNKYKQTLADFVYSSLNFMAFIRLELFEIMSRKIRHYTPEVCFQTANPETWIKGLILSS